MNKLIIFDLDDTLIYTHNVYLDLSRQFIDLMADVGIEDDNLYQTLDSFDQENVESDGCYLQSAFPRAMLQTYEFYCQKLDVEFRDEIGEQVVEIGWQVNSADYPLVDGAKTLLDGLVEAGHTLVLLTQGESEIQRRKITDKNLQIYFKELFIVPKKDADSFAEVMRRYDASPEQTWIIGNSLRSEVAAAIKLGTNCILTQVTTGWSYEQDECVKNDFPTVKELIDCLEIIR